MQVDGQLGQPGVAGIKTTDGKASLYVFSSSAAGLTKVISLP